MADLIDPVSGWGSNVGGPALQTKLVTPVNAALADSGWVNLTLAGSFTNAGPINLQPAYRVKGGWVSLRGYAAGTFTASGTNVIVAAGGIPAGSRPANTARLPVAAQGIANLAYLWVGADGSLTIQSGSTVPTWVSLAGAAWIGDV